MAKITAQSEQRPTALIFYALSQTGYVKARRLPLVNLSAEGICRFFHRELKNHESVRRVDAAA